MTQENRDLWIEAMRSFFQRKNGNWIVNRKEVEKYNFDNSIPFHVREFLSSYKNEERHYSLTHFKLLQEEVLKFRPTKDNVQEFKHKLMTTGQYKVLECLDVQVRLSQGDVIAHLNSLNEDAIIDPLVIEMNPNLLSRSIWGLCEIEHLGGPLDGRSSRNNIKVVNFRPIETHNVNPKAVKDAFTSIGKSYGLDHCIQIWAQIMLATLGLNPNNFDLSKEEDFKKYLIQVTRIIPLVCDNVFLIETGNPGNGKTTAANRSAYSRAIPIDAVSMAKVFFHSGTRQPGVVQGLDYLAFDDIQTGGLAWKKIDSLSATLLSFMNNSTLGQVVVPPNYNSNSGCSISFLGNTKGESCLVNPNQYFSHVPESMRQTQFLDRINGYIDGHSISKFNTSWDGEALQADIFNRFLYEVRRNKNLKSDFSRFFSEEFVELKNVGARCRYSIQNVATGILLLIYPNYVNVKGTRKMDQPDSSLLRLILTHAIELRQNVRFLASRSGNYQPDKTANYNEPITFSDKWAERV